MSPVASDKYLPNDKAVIDVAAYLEQIAMNETVPGTASLSHRGADTFMRNSTLHNLLGFLTVICVFTSLGLSVFWWNDPCLSV